MQKAFVSGDLFKIFMVAYFSFRLTCDFLKPDARVFLGMSSIQWACVAMLVYYSSDWLRWLNPRTGTRRARRLANAREALRADRETNAMTESSDL